MKWCLAILLCLVLPGMLYGATYHVTSHDKDANDIDDQDGTCNNHASVGSGFVSCADSNTAGCTLAKPCCTIQTALDKATGNGDIVEIHAGEYNADASWHTTTAVGMGNSTYCGGSDTLDTLAVIKSNASATQESHRRIFRGACEKSGAFGDATCDKAVDTADRPHLTASTTGGKNLAVSFSTNIVDSGPSGDTDYTTLSNLEISGFQEECTPLASGTWFPMAVWFRSASSTDTIIEHLYIHDLDVPVDNNGEGNGFAVGHHSGAGSCDTTGCISRLKIINNDITGPIPWMVYGSSAACSGANYTGTGIQVSGNTFTTTSADGILSEAYIKSVADIVFFNNLVDGGTGVDGYRFRQTGSVWLFNNHYKNWHLWSDQDDCGTWNIFNETYWTNLNIQAPWNTSTSVDDANYAVVVKNVSVDGYQTAFRSANTAAVVTGGYIHANQTVKSAVNGLTHDGDAFEVDLGNYICDDDQACQAQTLHTDCYDTENLCDDDVVGIDFASGPPWLITDGNGTVVGAGTNDPLGQGAGVCSITIWSGNVVDCSLDRDGNDRGTVWDIGADQFVAPASSNPSLSNGVTISGGKVE